MLVRLRQKVLETYYIIVRSVVKIVNTGDDCHYKEANMTRDKCVTAGVSMPVHLWSAIKEVAATELRSSGSLISVVMRHFLKENHPDVLAESKKKKDRRL
jgi:hypothetical protein